MELIHCNNNKELIRKVGNWLIAFLKDQLDHHKKVDIAISGGSTPLSLFSFLADKFKDELNWQQVHIWWVDERFVPHSDPENNFHNAMEAGLKNIPATYHRIHTEGLAFEEVIENYRKEWLRFSNGNPLDVVILGAGEDGHTASLFQENMNLIRDSNAIVGTLNPHNQQQRITFNFKELISARNSILLLTGEKKKPIFNNINSDVPYPVNYVIQHSVNAKVYVDF